MQYHRRCEASAWLRKETWPAWYACEHLKKIIKYSESARRANFTLPRQARQPSARNAEEVWYACELDEATELHSHQKSRRNSRAIAPRTTART
ncbi:MAG: hypothetical protein IKH97_07575 [Bacteroidales bacterium]|nr:hypothetical protein [Bacteroidales bacterium]